MSLNWGTAAALLAPRIDHSVVRHMHQTTPIGRLHVCIAGGVLRLKQSLESRLGRPQHEALRASYGVAALLANKNDIAKEAIRCGNVLSQASNAGAHRSNIAYST